MTDDNTARPGRDMAQNTGGAPGLTGTAPDLTVIVISYNTRDLTLAALRSLCATTKATRFHTVVLDNASADGSADAVAEAFPQVELIRSGENLGFARANNVVAAQARTEWLLLLNPDTEVHPGAVDNLLAFGRAHPEAQIYGGRTVFPDGSLNAGSCYDRITPWSVFCSATGLTAAFSQSAFFAPETLGGWKRDSEREVDIVSGCFFLIRRDLWNRLGGFDLRYFMYGEEADLCLRARRDFGARPRITPDAEIMHLAGASSATKVGKRLLVTKARVTLMRDHWPAWQMPFGAATMRAWAGGRLVASALLAPLGGSSRARLAYWREVWQKRHDWLAGW
ncbi:MAG TPA: glycosyltransferase family 2 protein [Paenirhodobacter sp.]